MSWCFPFLLFIRAVCEWRETCGWWGEEGAVWGEANEGGDVAERAEASAPHGVPCTQWREEEGKSNIRRGRPEEGPAQRDRNYVSSLWTGGGQAGEGGDWEARGGRGAVQRIPAGWVGGVQAVSGGRLQKFLCLNLPQGICHLSHQGTKTSSQHNSNSKENSQTGATIPWRNQNLIWLQVPVFSCLMKVFSTFRSSPLLAYT